MFLKAEDLKCLNYGVTFSLLQKINRAREHVMVWVRERKIKKWLNLSTISIICEIYSVVVNPFANV